MWKKIKQKGYHDGAGNFKTDKALTRDRNDCNK